MQILGMNGDTVLGKVCGRSDGKLAERASEPHGNDLFFQQLAQSDSKVITVRNDVCDGIADRNVQRDLWICLAKTGKDWLQVIDIGNPWRNDAERTRRSLLLVLNLFCSCV